MRPLPPLRRWSGWTPARSAVLQAMTYFYKESHRLDLIAAMYERPSSSSAKSEDLLTSLFMAHVRVLDHKKQQLTAAKLHRLAPSKNPYYFWSVMSVLMQATECGGELASKMLLPLAAKMAEAFRDRMNAEAEVQLYLMVLEMQERFEDCLATLDGPLSSFNEMGYLEKLGRKQELADARWEDLTTEPNDWARWQSCIQSSINADISQGGDYVEADPRLSELHGPCLARLELMRRCPVSCRPETALSLMRSYFEAFASRPAVASDLLQFRSLLSDTDENSSPAKLLELIRPGLPEWPKAAADADRQQLVRDLTARINYEQLSRGLLNKPMDAEQRNAKVAELIQAYRANLLDGLRPTESAYTTTPGLLKMPNRAKTHLLQALYLLDEGLSGSPSNYNIMLWMIRLFIALGAWTPASNLYERLDVKQILLESVGFVLSRQVARCGLLSQGLVMLNNTAMFYKNNWRDIVEHLCTAYRIGNFRKVPELVALTDRVSSSLESVFCGLELRHQSLLLSGPNIVEGVYEMGAPPESSSSAESPQPAFDGLVDGRDFRLVREFRSDLLAATADASRLLEDERAWLLYRSLGLRCVSHLTRMATEMASTGSVTKQADAARALKQQLMEQSAGSTGDSLPAFDIEPHPCLPYPACLPAHFAAGSQALLAPAIDYFLNLLPPSTDNSSAGVADASSIDPLLESFDAQLAAVEVINADGATAPVEPLFGQQLQRLSCLCESACLLSLVHELTAVALAGKLAMSKKQRRPYETFCRTVRSRIGDRINRAAAALEALEAVWKAKIGQAWTDADGQEETVGVGGDDGGQPKRRCRAKVDELLCQSRCRCLGEMLNLLRFRFSN
uniref:N-terminal acetyltransferase B complex subunit NAA25 homolog n=1 Tax=Macrostomum lignano TaxID=282301 RepID=A0A1I8J6L5_9PLAT